VSGQYLAKRSQLVTDLAWAQPGQPRERKGVSEERAKTVLETALEEELAEHLGYDKHDPLGRN
jgi:transposase-like protein